MPGNEPPLLLLPKSCPRARASRSFGGHVQMHTVRPFRPNPRPDVATHPPAGRLPGHGPGWVSPKNGTKTAFGSTTPASGWTGDGVVLSFVCDDLITSNAVASPGLTPDGIRQRVSRPAGSIAIVWDPFSPRSRSARSAGLHPRWTKMNQPEA